MSDLTPSSTTLRCIGTFHDRDADKTYFEFEFKTLGGHLKITNVPRELMRMPQKIADILLGKGAVIEGDPVEAVKIALTTDSGRHREGTGKTGWIEGSFVYPGETFGKLADTLFYMTESQIDPAMGLKAGTLENWQAGLKRPCRYSDYLILAASLAPASSLLELAHEDEGVIFHLHGMEPKAGRKNDRTKSSSGKTTAARVSASLIGRCRKTDLISFAITERAVEEFCFAHNHLSVALDEEGRSAGAQSNSSKVKLASLPYIIPSGRGTMRSKMATGNPALQNLIWAALAISTGEGPIDDAGSSRPEGAQVRQIGIPVPSGRRGGIFNRVSGNEKERTKKSAVLVHSVEQAIAENYGVVMSAFLRVIVAKQLEISARLPELLADFLAEVGVAQSAPWERRFAGKFGILYAAAYLMAEFQIGPWTQKKAKFALKRLYEKARAATISPPEATDAFVRRIRTLITAGKRFPTVAKGEKYNAKNTWGLVRRQTGTNEQTVLIRLGRLERLVKPAAACAVVMTELDARGILMRGSDGKLTRQSMLGGRKRQRYVVLSCHALGVVAPLRSLDK